MAKLEIKWLLGDEAKEYLTTCLAEKRIGAKYVHPTIKGPAIGHYQEGDIWIAFDNTTGELWQEEFEEVKQVIRWLKQI